MANPYFKFKKFIIFQDNCAMKVGTDGVLLGSWTPIYDAETILDIGSGTGLISLMLAQRSYKAKVLGVELDTNAYIQSLDNIKLSPWSDRVNVVNTDFRDYSTEGGLYDLIVSNPPYFINSKLAPDNTRSIARHTSFLSYTELIDGVLRNLKPSGYFSIILPAQNFEYFSLKAKLKGLFEIQRLMVYPTPYKAVSRILSLWTRQEIETVKQQSLILEIGGRHNYSPEYLSLTKEFYLKV